MLTPELFRHKSEEVAPSVLKDRRHLHQHPELSFREYKTSAYIKSRLQSMGIEWVPNLETGIVATIRGRQPNTRCIALRADMDGLPIQEIGHRDYKSTVNGTMHACGHDVHTASLLGTAAILEKLKDHFFGTVKLIFQPGEEVLPGGAIGMIEAGVLENPTPSLIIGQHVSPMLTAGTLGFCKGPFMASMDELFLEIIGKGGHAAQPHLNTDPVIEP